MVVGVLNSYDRFAAFAISPFFWNVVIIVVLVLLEPAFHGNDRIYAYAIGVLVGTVVQLAIPAWDLRNTPFRLTRDFDWHMPEVRRVLLLMLPVTLSLGLINFDLLLNSIVGTLVSDQAPAAIDKAFRIYMLPQGIFSVAVATVTFPTLARFAARQEWDNLRATMANGMRQILLLLIPAAAAVLVLSVPMTRLVYQRGEFDADQTHLVAQALFWFAFSLPFNGLYLLLTRTFFSLQRPWVPTAVAGSNLVVDIIFSFALYSPFGVGGVVAATVIATVSSVVAEAVILRRQLHGLELGRLMDTAARVIAAAALLAGVSYLVWYGLDQALGRSTIAQIVSLGGALLAGFATYFGRGAGAPRPGGRADHPAGAADLSAIRLGRPGIADPVARARAGTTRAVSGVGELAAVQREAAAADALREPGAQPLELGDPLIDPGRPAARQPRPVAAVGASVRRELGELSAISPSVRPIRWAKTMKAIRRSTERGYRR